MHATILKMDNQQRPIYYLAHGTLLDVICQLGWEGFWAKMDTCMCIAESLFYSPELPQHC